MKGRAATKYINGTYKMHSLGIQYRGWAGQYMDVRMEFGV